jgi:tetratricopeptide (TPR) repeat protein
MRGLYPAAIQHYEEALRLFLYVDNDDELAHIYYGVCDTYRKAGQLREAQLAGEKALHLYERTENHPLEGRMHNQLGKIAFLLGHFKKAADHYTEALAIAVSSGGVQMAMLNCAALAELRLAESRLEEAKRYSQRAQELSQRSQSSFLRGQTYLVVGKVTFAEARETEDTHKRERLEEAIEQFEIAHSHLSLTEAYDELAETLVCWAQAVEALGRAEEAMHLWRSAYQTLANMKGFG